MTIAAIAAIFAMLASIVPLLALRSSADAAPIGQGFTINESDLRFILQQIKISERHASETTVSDPCAGLIGTDPDQIPAGPHAVELPFGLRTIDGSCNNLVPGQNTFGQADQAFPRLVPADPSYPAGSVCDDAPYAPVVGPPCVQFPFDGPSPDPRTVSNLIVDQTATNPAAVGVSGAIPPLPVGTLDILNVAPDEGLSAPFNSWFTLFGQFFDHGLDLVNKGGAGAVIVPVQPGDPLHSTAPGAMNFMILTRASNGGVNQTSPFVDQSQTYASHPSHQVFLRDYELNVDGDPVSTGRLIEGSNGAPTGGMADWDRVQAQAASELGIQLVDKDALNIPLLVTDPYGRFIPGAGGFPQIVVDTDLGTPGLQAGLVEGDPTANVGTGVLAVTGTYAAVRTGHAFLDDIAHHAAPTGTLTPDLNLTVDTSAAPGTYDDELLGWHFIAGDGRANENIGLTAVHHIFHSEHNRLVGDVLTPAADSIRGVINASGDAAFRAEWHLGDPRSEANPWDGERLFQAARFITEMEYQHLAFEEFARKVQPMVNVFAGYDPSINPAITAEFAHAVYRFGHSMLRESVDRITTGGVLDSDPLLNVFLNPVEFTRGGLVTPETAAGDLIRGMTAQQGSEIDEFVTDVLRNALVGLPLDLPVLNIARGRETAIPRLNDVRASLFDQTGDSALLPYANWSEFGLAMKYSGASLENFIAAYGIDPSLTGTLAARRLAAAALAADPVFMAAPAATTGLNNVDLWMGGLAEAIDPFGGLLGPTFNHVFEVQMERLQDGDRFYYLSRTAGLNLLVQLEGNSFAELIDRNTDAAGLPGDVFSLPACIFNMDTQDYGVAGLEPGLPAPGCDPFIELTNGGRYAGGEHVVINGQDANTGPGIDERLWSGIGDDTVRGNGGDDWIQGGAGVDGLVGGAGDDIILDSNGDDDIKGGPGNDVISGGDGFDLLQPGTGDDFVVFGSDPTEAFGSQGNDLLMGGDSFDTIFGDDGDDWIEGGGQADLLQGDNGAPFQDDPNAPGHDVIIGQGGNDDYDAEGGDDIMVAGPGIERNEGMRGYDWTTYIGDTQPANADMNFTGFQPVEQDTLRDRFDLTEGLSGFNGNDILRGDNGAAFVPLADPLENSLDAAGIARIANLASTQNPGVGFNANIILGGAGDDVLEGRGGDDILDGDRWLNVRLAQTSNPVNTWGGLNSIRSMLLTGALNPGDIDIVREILTATGPDSDTAVFSDVIDNYEFAVIGDAVAVSHLGGTGIDGTDTLRNVERVQFAADVAPADGIADVDVNGQVILAPSVLLSTLLDAPTVLSTTPANGATNVSAATSVTVAFSEEMLGVDDVNLSLRTGSVGGAIVPATVTFDSLTDTATLVPTGGLAPSTTYFIVVDGGPVQIRSAVNGVALVDVNFSFTTGAAPAGTPTVTAQFPAPGQIGIARGADITATFSVNVTGTNATTVTLTRISNGNQIPGAVTYNAGTQTVTLNPNGNLRRGTLYEVSLIGGPAAIRNAITNAPLTTVTWLFTTAP